MDQNRRRKAVPHDVRKKQILELLDGVPMDERTIREILDAPICTVSLLVTELNMLGEVENCGLGPKIPNARRARLWVKTGTFEGELERIERPHPMLNTPLVKQWVDPAVIALCEEVA